MPWAGRPDAIGPAPSPVHTEPYGALRCLIRVQDVTVCSLQLFLQPCPWLACNFHLSNGVDGLCVLQVRQFSIAAWCGED